jgi:hypothetical protein
MPSAAIAARLLTHALVRLLGQGRDSVGLPPASVAPLVTGMATTAVEGKMAEGHRGSTSVSTAYRAPCDAARASLRGLLEPRPADFPYVVTQGTFLIGSRGNYLIADRPIPSSIVARARVTFLAPNSARRASRCATRSYRSRTGAIAEPRRDGSPGTPVPPASLIRQVADQNPKKPFSWSQAPVEPAEVVISE